MEFPGSFSKYEFTSLLKSSLGTILQVIKPLLEKDSTRFHSKTYPRSSAFASDARAATTLSCAATTSSSVNVRSAS